MKYKVILTAMVIALLMVPSYLCASTVFETTGWILDKQGLVYQFTADQKPLNYKATITNLSVAPNFGLTDIFLSVSSSTQVLDFRYGEGSIIFPVVEGATYFANIFAIGTGAMEAGNFGLKIETVVPIPATLMLLGSGVLGLIAMRRRRG